MPHAFDEGQGAVFLLVFALVLGVLLSVGAPLIQADSAAKLSDWLGFSGNVISGIAALIAAFVAWRAVQRQLRHAERLRTEAKVEEEFATQAMLPLALSALLEYADGCLHALHGIPLSGPTRRADATHPPLPVAHLSTLKDCIRLAPRQQAVQIANVLKLLQVQHARFADFINELRAGSRMVRTTKSERLRDTLNLKLAINDLFEYARGPEFRTPLPSSDRFRSEMMISNVTESEFPGFTRWLDERDRNDRP